MLPDKPPCHMCNLWLISCTFLLSKQLLGSTFCLKLGSGVRLIETLVWTDTWPIKLVQFRSNQMLQESFTVTIVCGYQWKNTKNRLLVISIPPPIICTRHQTAKLTSWLGFEVEVSKTARYLANTERHRIQTRYFYRQYESYKYIIDIILIWGIPTHNQGISFKKIINWNNLLSAPPPPNKHPPTN